MKKWTDNSKNDYINYIKHLCFTEILEIKLTHILVKFLCLDQWKAVLINAGGLQTYIETTY